MAKRTKFESVNSIFSRAKFCRFKDQKFKLKRINSTYYLESDVYPSNYKSKNNFLDPWELVFIRKVKREIIARFDASEYFDRINENDIHYILVREKLNEGVYNGYEIDIVEAYWRTAFLKGLISEQTYDEGNKRTGKLSKLGRLIALGTLAKKEYIYEFSGKKLVRSRIERSIETENIWYSICLHVSNLMQEATKIAGDSFIHYWVDGIYISDGKKAQKIEKFFRDSGYETKSNQFKIEINSEQIIVHDPDRKENGLIRPKQFFRPKNKNKKRKVSPELLMNPNKRLNQILKK